MLDFLAVQSTSPNPSFITIFYTVLLSFLLSTLIALTYEKTFRGLSYSRNFVQALVLSAIVAATVMHAIGDSLARGLGMLGALAIIRFRINIRDPRDIIFMFASLAAGIASGVCGYAIAVVGTFFFCAVAVVLYLSPFGQTSHFDGMLRFNIENNEAHSHLVQTIANKFCKIFALVTLRELSQGERLEYAYHVKLRRGMTNEDFVKELKTIESIQGVSLLLQETTVEL
jgi:uncharacterized membrane protein YhiD involved in acid resistance